MAGTMKLRYADGRGISETIRITLAAAGKIEVPQVIQTRKDQSPVGGSTHRTPGPLVRVRVRVRGLGSGVRGQD
jgi:hypothetical protein